MSDSGPDSQRHARRGWHHRRGGERLFWCDGCGVPLLGRRCGRCGREARMVPLSPPGDIRPVMRHGRQLLRDILARDFGLPRSTPVLSGLLLFNRIAGPDRTDQLFIDGRNAGTLAFDPLGRAFRFMPTAAGASLMLAAGATRLVELSGAAGHGHLKGKSLPATAFQEPLPVLPAGTEVLVSGRGLAAAGRVQDGGIRIRDIGPAAIRFSGVRTTMDDAVEANKAYLEELEAKALGELRAEVSRRHGIPLTVSFSGGKDSLVALELARRLGGRPTMLFSNTGLEYPETVEHVRALAREKELRLLEEGAGEAFWENLPHFGLPAKDYRWCCKVCKLAPMTGLLSEHFPDGVLTVEGRRRRESFARQRIRPVEESPFVPGQTNLEPIRDWTALEVWLYIRWRRLPYNPLYDEDLERIGCWLCPATLESELEGLKRTHPQLYRKWSERLMQEGRKQGLDGRAVSLGAWRWKALPPKMRELMSSAGIASQAPERAEGAQATLAVAGGISPCVTGGYTVDAALKLPVPLDLAATAGLLHMLGDARYSEDMGVALVRGPGMSAKLFESGQMVVTGQDPKQVQRILRQVVGLVMRASMCSGCGLCVQSCSKKALRLEEKKRPILDPSKCSRCQKCAESCVLEHYSDKMVQRLVK